MPQVKHALFTNGNADILVLVNNGNTDINTRIDFSSELTPSTSTITDLRTEQVLPLSGNKKSVHVHLNRKDGTIIEINPSQRRVL